MKFFGSFAFNRKRNVLELEIRQDYTSSGTQKYVVSSESQSVVSDLQAVINEASSTCNHCFHKPSFINWLESPGLNVDLLVSYSGVNKYLSKWIPTCLILIYILFTLSRIMYIIQMSFEMWLSFFFSTKL